MRLLPTVLCFCGLLAPLAAEQLVPYQGPVTVSPDNLYLTILLPHNPVRMYLPAGINFTKDSPYQYTVWVPDSNAMWEDPELESIREGTRILYDGSLCEVHKVHMHRGDIVIDWGDPGPDYFKQLKPAPHAGHTLGGCILPPNAPKTRRGYICPICEKR